MAKMLATGIIFSNIHDDNIPELTRLRTIASVPFACRYRFIDFTLSNMVNSNIYNINVITHHNYRSLMDHVGSGKNWDLARRSGGLKILPPFLTPGGKGEYQTRLESLKSVRPAIDSINDEYVVLADCDVICNADFSDMIENHRKTGADITFAVKRVKLTREEAKQHTIYKTDADGRLVDIELYPTDFEGEADFGLNILVMSTTLLQQIVADSVVHNYTSLTKDIIARNMDRMNFRVYRYDGYFACITSLKDYFKRSLELIYDKKVRESLFNVNYRPIYTKVRNSAPAYYAPMSNVKNSLVADGCWIEGTVENSIIFRGAKIGKNATVRNSIIMQDSIISPGAFLNYVITDKNAVVRDGLMLSGAEEQPFYVSKGKMI